MKKNNERRKKKNSNNVRTRKTNYIKNRNKLSNKEKLEIKYKNYCKRINKYYDNILKNDPQLYNHNDRCIDLKRCEICLDFKKGDLTILCDVCDDAYHIFCLDPPYESIPKSKFECPNCYNDKVMSGRIITNKILKSNKEERCGKCNSKKESKECSLCLRHKHLDCLLNKRLNNCSNCFYKEFLNTLNIKFDSVKQNDSHNPYDDIYTNFKLKLPKELSVKQDIIQSTSIDYAFSTKNIEFNDDLQYSEISRNMNDASIEPGITSLSDYNINIFNQFKSFSRRKKYAPIMIVEDMIQGFIVKAIDNIPIYTIICEYSGEVTLVRKKLFDDTNDSIFDLIKAPSSSQSLIIDPARFSNIGRFISGINNKKNNSKKKINLNSIRFKLQNEVHILLYAIRNIKKNEILYYDYNAGGYDAYPTENFI